MTTQRRLGKRTNKDSLIFVVTIASPRAAHTVRARPLATADHFFKECRRPQKKHQLAKVMHETAPPIFFAVMPESPENTMAAPKIKKKDARTYQPTGESKEPYALGRLAIIRPPTTRQKTATSEKIQVNKKYLSGMGTMKLLRSGKIEKDAMRAPNKNRTYPITRTIQGETGSCIRGSCGGGTRIMFHLSQKGGHPRRE
jgi:hypothetical protein